MFIQSTSSFHIALADVEGLLDRRVVVKYNLDDILIDVEPWLCYICLDFLRQEN